MVVVMVIVIVLTMMMVMVMVVVKVYLDGDGGRPQRVELGQAGRAVRELVIAVAELIQDASYICVCVCVCVCKGGAR
jgi:hypothetical protein